MKLMQQKNDKRRSLGMTKHQTRKYSRWAWRSIADHPSAQGWLRAPWSRNIAPKKW